MLPSGMCRSVPTVETPTDGVMDKEHRDAFQKFIRNEFVEKKKPSSKVITQAKGAQIVAFLNGDAAGQDAHFKFWVKSCGFCLMDYPTLGLKSVMCLPCPAKKKVTLNR